MIKGFKDFLLRGNVVDLAVALQPADRPDAALRRDRRQARPAPQPARPAPGAGGPLGADGRPLGQAVAAALAAREVRVEPDLYRASTQQLVHLLAATADPVRSLVVVGHEPVVSATAVALAGPGSDGAALAAVRAGARTGSATVLELPGGWGSLTAGSCALVAYLVP